MKNKKGKGMLFSIITSVIGIAVFLVILDRLGLGIDMENLISDAFIKIKDIVSTIKDIA